MSEKPIAVAEISELLAKSLGDKVAMTWVLRACEELGIDGQRGVTVEQAVQVLERIALERGIVGITARFAISRLHLRLAAAVE